MNICTYSELEYNFSVLLLLLLLYFDSMTAILKYHTRTVMKSVLITLFCDSDVKSWLLVLYEDCYCSFAAEKVHMGGGGG
jgi:hypothetical protein